VRRLLPPLFVLWTAFGTGALAQAPPSAGLWRVTTGSLAVPAALQSGETGAFWNPAAAASAIHIAVGAHVVHTGSALGLSSLLGAGSLGVLGPARAGIVLGRVQIRDLVRTTTSPDSRGGSIPVYEQFVGITFASAFGPVQAGTQLQLHESRFDFESQTGLTLDFGVRAHPIPRLELAASTHLLPLGFGSDENTDYYLGADYTVIEGHPEQGLQTRLHARYGITRQGAGAWEHVGSVGTELGQVVVLDAGLASEAGYGTREWRPTLALALRFGHYTVSLAHGLGMNDVGGTFRVGLDMELGP
jgi:hypothetical protein